MRKVAVKKLDVADSSTLFKLIRLINLVSRPFNEVAGKQHQLSLNDWRVMVVLASHPGATATEIVSYTGLDKMGVSRAIAHLIKQKRAERWADPEDARRAQVRLTTQGFAIAKVISKSAVVREKALFSVLSSADKVKLETVLDKLTRAIDV